MIMGGLFMQDRINKIKEYFFGLASFFSNNKKWWVTPMLVFLLLGILLILYLINYRSPDFIYSLF